MTTPTIELRARTAAGELQRRARTVSRENRAAIADLERRITLRRFATAGATLVVALIAAVTWVQATQPPPPPLVSEGAGPTAQPTSGTAHPEPAAVEYADGQILARPDPGDTAEAVSVEPETGTCIGPAKVLDLVTLVIGPDAKIVGPDAATDCLIVWGQQRVRIAAHDGDYAAFTAELAGWGFRLGPGQAVVLDMPAEQYLDRGAHRIESDFEPARAIIWWPPPAHPSVDHP